MVVGSERFGYKFDGEKCIDYFLGIFIGNEVYGVWYGVYLYYEEGFLFCVMLFGFFIWKNYDYGIFIYC